MSPVISGMRSNRQSKGNTASSVTTVSPRCRRLCHAHRGRGIPGHTSSPTHPGCPDAEVQPLFSVRISPAVVKCHVVCCQERPRQPRTSRRESPDSTSRCRPVLQSPASEVCCGVKRYCIPANGFTRCERGRIKCYARRLSCEGVKTRYSTAGRDRQAGDAGLAPTHTDP